MPNLSRFGAPLVLIAFAWLVVNQVFGNEGDQVVYLNYALKRVDDTLFPNDYLFQNNFQYELDITARIASWASKFGASIRAVYYVLFLAFTAGLAILIFDLVRSVIGAQQKGGQRLAIAALLIVMSAVGIVPIDALRQDVTPGLFSFVLTSAAVVFALRGRLSLAFGSLVVAMYFNGSYPMALFPPLILFSVIQIGWRQTVRKSVRFTLALVPLLVIYISVKTRNPIFYSDDWASAVGISGELSWAIGLGWISAAALLIKVGSWLLASAVTSRLDEASAQMRRRERLLGLIMIVWVALLTAVSFLASFRFLAEARAERFVGPVMFVIAILIITRLLTRSSLILRIGVVLALVGHTAVVRSDAVIRGSTLILDGAGFDFSPPDCTQIISASVCGSDAITLIMSGILPLAIVLLALAMRRQKASNDHGFNQATIRGFEALGYIVFVIGFAYLLNRYGWNPARNPGFHALWFALATLTVWFMGPFNFSTRRIGSMVPLFAIGISFGILLTLFSPFSRDLLVPRLVGLTNTSPINISDSWDSAFLWTILLGILLMIMVALLRLSSRKYRPRLAAVAILFLVVASAGLGVRSYSPPAIYSWISLNTAEDSVFLVDYDSFHAQHLRYFGRRSPYVVEEDNSAVLFNDDYLHEFNRRVSQQAGWDEYDSTRIDEILEITGVDYVLHTQEFTSSKTVLEYSEDGYFVSKVLP